jgi:predicted DNA repair protein MutK
MITICLIPVSIIGIIILVVAVVFGWIALGLEVGKRLGIALNQKYQPVVMAGLGTLVLSLVVNGINFIPCVGWLAPFLVGAVGLGGVVLSRFGTQTYMISAAPVPTGEEAIVEVPPTDEPEEQS